MSPRMYAVGDPAKIGARIKHARLAAGLSQREFAKLTPYTAAYISRLEAGARNPTFNALRHFGAALGISAEWLETGVAGPADHEARALVNATLAKKAIEVALDALHEAHAELEKVLA